MNETDLLSKGYRQQPDGSWAKRPVPVGAVEANRPERPPIQTLDGRLQEPTGSEKGVAVSITVVAFRRRLLDAHDAVAYACKPLTDAIAESLGVDDADRRLHWEYHQLKTTGPEGTIVLISL